MKITERIAKLIDVNSIVTLALTGVYGYLSVSGRISELKVKTGDLVACTDIIGIEGSTGHSTASHCHYEIRRAFYKGAEVVDICEKSGIPNVQGGTYDDGYRPDAPDKKTMNITVEYAGIVFSGMLTES